MQQRRLSKRHQARSREHAGRNAELCWRGVVALTPTQISPTEQSSFHSLDPPAWCNAYASGRGPSTERRSSLCELSHHAQPGTAMASGTAMTGACASPLHVSHQLMPRGRSRSYLRASPARGVDVTRRRGCDVTLANRQARTGRQTGNRGRLRTRSGSRGGAAGQVTRRSSRSSGVRDVRGLQPTRTRPVGSPRSRGIRIETRSRGGPR
jgi:hypothetical protein